MKSSIVGQSGQILMRTRMPMEVAEIAKNKEASLLLKQKFAQLQSNRVREQPFNQILFNETALDSAASVLNSMDNALLLSDAKRLLEQMSKGIIPCGIWKSFSSRLTAMKQDIQNLIEDIQKQVQGQSTKENLQNLPDSLQEENAKLKKEIEQLRSALKKENQILQFEKTVEELKRCESQCIRNFRAKFVMKESPEWDDVGLYMNVAGLAHQFKKVQDLGCSAGRAMHLISKAPAALELPLADKLKLKFANHVFEKGGLQSVEDHVVNCQICRQPSHVFLKEYFPAGTENNKDLTASQLMMIDTLAESCEAFGFQNAQELLKTAKEILNFHSTIES